ncbi:MAG TPA: Coq4 family protein [Polyangiaceae bacterium]|nr:Coq4 family protein [Polyangiaceae bacterium]
MKRLLRKVAALRSMITIARDPRRLDAVFKLRESLDEGKALGPVLARLRANEVTAKALRERARVGRVDLAALGRLPEGTLGRAYADFLRAAGLDPSNLPVLESRNEFQWFAAHLYETHDVWHVATGFGPDVAGELGLQAFYLAQFESPLPVAILAAGMLNTALSAMPEAGKRMEEIARGWQLGRAARPLFGFPWAEHWSRPLDDVRRELGLPASPGGELAHLQAA